MITSVANSTNYQFVCINAEPFIEEGELMALKSKTFRHMKLRELLLQHSANANLVVM